MSGRLRCIIAVGFAILLASSVGAVIPKMVNFQGVLTDTLGNQVPDGNYSVTFRIYDASSGGNVLWQEAQLIAVSGGLFNYLLGSATPIPDTVFRSSPSWLGIQLGLDPEMSPRVMIVSVGYTYRAGNVRDTYHEIVDVMPNSTLKSFIVPRYPNSKVSLYLHGEGFAGAALSHTHSGNNAHDHTYSGTSAAQSVDHTHTYSGNTGSESADHTHSGTTNSTDLSHQHSGGIGLTSLSHIHSGGVTEGTVEHRHNFAYQGAGSGVYLVHAGQPTTGLSGTTTENSRVSGSVMLDGSHVHGFNTSAALGDHNHSLTINYALGGHTHPFSTGGISANHSHGFSGSTLGVSVGHAHGFSGTTSSTGSGLSLSGVASGTLPTNVKIYIDGAGVPVAGPFSGQFSSGPIDLSSVITDTQEHSIEIKEEGGTGGRLIYTIFVE